MKTAVTIPSVYISLGIRKDILDAIPASNRSEYIRIAICERLEKDKVLPPTLKSGKSLKAWWDELKK